MAVRLPGTLLAEQVSALFGFQPHDIPVLVAAKLLVPLGNPTPTSVKHFAASDVVAKAANRKWLHRAVNCIYRHWRKNHQHRNNKPKESKGHETQGNH